MASCRFVMLGVPVVVRCSSGEIINRVELCYSALPRHESEDEDCVQAEVDSDAGGWRVRVTEREAVVAEDLVAAVRTLNHELLHGLMLRRRELFYVHAGVVVVDGEALILPGLSRAGKSTLVLALLQQGAGFLSDELLVFDPADQKLLPFPRAIKVRDECVGYFPTLAEQFVGEGEGRFLPFDAIEDLRMAASATPGHIAVPRWQAGHTDLVETLTRGQGLVQLTGSVLNFGSHGSASIDHLAVLLGAVSCFSITWSDPHAAVSLLLKTMRRQRSQLPS